MSVSWEALCEDIQLASPELARGVWSSTALPCRDCGLADLPVEGGARCPYCYELWLLKMRGGNWMTMESIR